MVTDQLALEASYGWVDAEYHEAEFLEAATGRSADEFDFTMVPEYSRRLAPSYGTSLGDLGSLTWRLSYSFVDSSASDDFNRLEVSRYELNDASVPT